MGMIKDRILRTQEKQKRLRRGGKNAQKNCIKKGLSDPNNHDGVVTHLELDILEQEVKYVLGSITTNKVDGDRISTELFQILKDDAVKKCYTQYVSKLGKLSNGHRTGKGQFTFQSQRKAMPKNLQTTVQLHSCDMLAR